MPSYTLSGMSVRSFQVVGVAHQLAGHVHGHVAAADHSDVLGIEAAIRGRRSGNRRTIPRTWRHRTRLQGRRPAGSSGLSLDGTSGEQHRVVTFQQLVKRHVLAEFHVAVQVDVRVIERLLESGCDEFDGRVVGGHAVAHQAEGHRHFETGRCEPWCPVPALRRACPAGAGKYRKSRRLRGRRRLQQYEVRWFRLICSSLIYSLHFQQGHTALSCDSLTCLATRSPAHVPAQENVQSQKITIGPSLKKGPYRKRVGICAFTSRIPAARSAWSSHRTVWFQAPICAAGCAG